MLLLQRQCCCYERYGIRSTVSDFNRISQAQYAYVHARCDQVDLIARVREIGKLIRTVHRSYCDNRIILRRIIDVRCPFISN
ncbi:hypothetical protein D3C84_1066130 [compost metagenome]